VVAQGKKKKESAKKQAYSGAKRMREVGVFFWHGGGESVGKTGGKIARGSGRVLGGEGGGGGGLWGKRGLGGQKREKRNVDIQEIPGLFSLRG